MKNISDFYILGIPIETEIGECHFLKVKEYPDHFGDLQIVSLTKSQLVYKYNEMNKDNSLTEFINELNKHSLFELSLALPELRESYLRLFIKVFRGDYVFDYLTPENFNYYRKLIMAMNGVKEEEVNPNPEIQRAIERSKRVKAAENEPLTFTDIVSSVVAFSGKSYRDLNDMTIYQLYMTFHRIAQIKNYDTTALFATVSDKVKIENWSKHIDLFKEDSHFVTQEEFNRTTGSIFSE